jgi:hypothetical protein
LKGTTIEPKKFTTKMGENRKQHFFLQRHFCGLSSSLKAVRVYYEY